MCMESRTRNCNGTPKANISQRTHLASTPLNTRRIISSGIANTFGQPKVRISFSSKNRG